MSVYFMQIHEPLRSAWWRLACWACTLITSGS